MTDENLSGQETNTNSTGESQEANANSEGSTALTGDSQQEGEANSEGNQAENTEGKNDEGKATSQTPESYEFNMPEGVELDKALADAVTPIFKELELTQEQADKITGVYANALTQQAKAQEDAFSAQLDTWLTELKNDKDIGGDKLDENVAQAREWVEAVLPKEIVEGMYHLYDTTGLGNNINFVKAFHILSTKFPVREDQPGNGNGATSQSTTREQRMYPDM